MQSSASRAFSILSSKIHPQLPLTPRESQQLLALLTTSFRQQLDNEYSRSPRSHSARPQLHNQSEDVVTKPSTSGPKSSHTLASKHLENVLTNPLFATKPQRRKSSTYDVKDARKLMGDPLQWFQELVASGSADIESAYLCLKAVQRMSPSSFTPDSTNHGNVGSKISDWLWSSGMEKTKPFLMNSEFIDSLVPCLIREHQEDRLWRWFTRSLQTRIREADVDVKQVRLFRAHLLKSMVTSKLNGDGGLEAAITTILRAASLRSTPSIGLSTSDTHLAGRKIVNHIISTTTPISIEVFDRFTHSAKEWSGQWELCQAILWLHSPSQPDANRGLEFLKNEAAVSRCRAPPSRRLLVQLSLGVARQLLAENRFSEGQWVLDFARRNLSEELGLQPERPPVKESSRKVSQDELGNLQLLDSLKLDL
ncbi:hypothetical protein AOQ84DRAFT_82251 [Glonium stellatum]|uniref:Uncharacterized protein n=1 Tax=Glonium stellatum TaxID=574774 RepID=A0A8E2EWF6_9PEZI|nr:hypothetical protein AOQ84DRAFT_82251 [Glonium stellatum]